MNTDAGVVFAWRGPFTNDEVNALHAEAFEHRLFDDDWLRQLDRHSVGWVTARDAEGLVGFVNVVWDGLVHAFLEDTIVARRARHRGVGARLVMSARDGSRVAGCEWLHVDFEDDLGAFYFDACGFTPTSAGLMRLMPETSA
ncbi:MAG: hypothetical protein JWP75_2054 [Frondihabitans sp.]|nr:hypothetical protein [Frondihabitans sp.]